MVNSVWILISTLEIIFSKSASTVGRNNVNVMPKSLSCSILSSLDSAKCVIPKDLILDTICLSPATHLITGVK